MKVTCKSKELMDAFKPVIKVVPKKAGKEILACVKIVAGTGGLSLHGYDGFVTYASAKMGCTVDQMGAICVDAKFLSDLLAKLKGTEVSIACEPGINEAHITSGRAKFSVPVKDPETFPPEPTYEEGTTLCVDAQILKDGVAGIAFCAAEENVETNPMLKGIALRINPDLRSIDIVALDGFRVAQKTLPLLETASEERTTIIPALQVSNFTKTLVGDQKVFIHIGKATVGFHGDSVAYTIQQIAGKFYDYAQFKTKDIEATCKVDKDQLMGSIERAQVMIGNEHIPIVVEMKDGILDVSLKTNRGRFEEETPCESEGTALVGFNPRYMQEMLANAKEAEVTLKFGGSRKPVLCEVSDGWYVVLPVNINR